MNPSTEPCPPCICAHATSYCGRMKRPMPQPIWERCQSDPRLRAVLDAVSGIPVPPPPATVPVRGGCCG